MSDLTRLQFLRRLGVSLLVGPAAARLALRGAPVVVTRRVGPVQEATFDDFSVKHLPDGRASLRLYWRDDRGFAQRRTFLFPVQRCFPWRGHSLRGFEVEDFRMWPLLPYRSVFAQTRGPLPQQPIISRVPVRVTWREVTYS